MSHAKRKLILSTVGSVALLCTGYILFRYVFFYLDLHGMTAWPRYLFVFGLIVIGAAALFDCSKVMLCTAVGYHIGYIAGLCFGREWIDQHGTAMDNIWIWHTLVMLAVVCVGVIWELIGKRVKATNRVVSPEMD